MEVKVRFRFNRSTGEVELFEVDDVGAQTLSDAEHNATHDRIAVEVGRTVQRHPDVREMTGPVAPPVEESPDQDRQPDARAESHDEAQPRTPRRHRQR